MLPSLTPFVGLKTNQNVIWAKYCTCIVSYCKYHLHKNQCRHNKYNKQEKLLKNQNTSDIGRNWLH